jgi:hypothetical protein
MFGMKRWRAGHFKRFGDKHQSAFTPSQGPEAVDDPFQSSLQRWGKGRPRQEP